MCDFARKPGYRYSSQSHDNLEFVGMSDVRRRMSEMEDQKENSLLSDGASIVARIAGSRFSRH